MKTEMSHQQVTGLGIVILSNLSQKISVFVYFFVFELRDEVLDFLFSPPPPSRVLVVVALLSHSPLLLMPIWQSIK